MTESLSPEALAPAELEAKNQKLAKVLVFVAIIMLVFSPILYFGGGALCTYFGLGINPENSEQIAADAEGTGRWLKNYLKAEMDPELKGLIRFTCDEVSQKVEIGKYTKIMYHIENVSDRTLYIRPIHTVTPNKAAQQFMMIECFCYNDMALKPGEKRDLPVVYGYNPKLDVRIQKADVLYSLHPITEAEMREKKGMPNEGAFKGGQSEGSDFEAHSSSSNEGAP